YNTVKICLSGYSASAPFCCLLSPAAADLASREDYDPFAWRQTGRPTRDRTRGAASRNTGRQWHTQGGVGMSDKVVHFEIPADDVERAQVFYRDAFGWTINAMPEMGYTIVMTTESDEAGTPVERGAINGGMLQRQGEIRSRATHHGCGHCER